MTAAFRPEDLPEEIRLRDHSRQCEHGSRWAHWEEVTKGRWWKDPDCPGGAEVVLRRTPDGTWAVVVPGPGD